ncbi:MAG TPA: DUF2975 domain-containing protein [Acidobacteriaceae bacterium]|jgi:hypothetical protein
MQSKTELKLRKIKRVSTILRWFCKVLMVLVVAGFVLSAGTLLANRGGSVGYFDVGVQVSALRESQRMMVLALSAATSAVWLTCIFQLHQLFGNYSAGDVFTRESVGRLRLIGAACVLWGVAKLLWEGVARAYSAAPHGSMQVTAETIPIGIMVLIVAWFMDMAVELREENELTV